MEERRLGRYELVDLLGQGGMGQVWRAHDSETRRTVALKLLPEGLARDAEFSERFRREAYAAARLNDPHVVPIHHFGEIDGHLYVDMRLIEGRDLQQLLREGPLHPVRAVDLVAQVGCALTAAHRDGLVHRDVKPSNIVVTGDDFAYLIDFGIARAVGEASLTGTGVTVGTANYMSPERVEPKLGPVDQRADVYALACVLYQCLTGRPPFAGGFAEVTAAHMWTPPPRPSQHAAGVPLAMDAVIATGMAKRPDDRYPTVAALCDAAKAALAQPQPTQPVHYPYQPPPYPPYQPPPQRRSRRPALLAGVVLAVVALVAAGVVGVVAMSSSGGEDGSASGTSRTTATTTAAADPAALLTDVAATTAALTSVRVKLTTQGEVAGLVAHRFDGSITVEPAPASKGTMDIRFVGQEVDDVDYVVTEGNFYAALTPGSWSDLGPSTDIFDPTALLNPGIGIAAWVSGLAQPRAAGMEQVAGASTQKVTGSLPGELLEKAFPGIVTAPSVPTTMWLDEADERLVRVELAVGPGQSLEFSMSDWDEPVTVVKPPL